MGQQPEDQALKDEAAGGFWNWHDQTESWSGGPAITLTGTTFTLKWFTNAGGPYATACPGGQNKIRFNDHYLDEYETDPVSFEGISTHEWGHVFGFRHAGKSDSRGSDNPPTLGTCTGIPGNAPRVSLSQDDEAAVQYLTNTTGGIFHAFSANPSWEEGTEHWKWASLASYSVKNSGLGADGSLWYARVKQLSNSGRLWQLNRLATEYTALGYGVDVKARVNVRKFSTSDLGHGQFRLSHRTVTYSDTDGDPTCQWPNGIDLDSSATYGPWVYGAWTFCTPQSTGAWNYCTTPMTTTPGGAHAVDLRIQVYPRMYKGGLPEKPPQYVRLDRVRTLVDDDLFN